MWNTNDFKWLAVDLDGTLAITHYPDFELDKPNYPFVNKLKKIVKENDYKIFVYTSRHWDDVIIIEKWLKKHRIPYKGIWCGKPLVAYFIDDKALRPEEIDKIKKHE